MGCWLQQLRELHVVLDLAVRDAYGWSDLELDHGFHDTPQGQARHRNWQLARPSPVFRAGRRRAVSLAIPPPEPLWHQSGAVKDGASARRRRSDGWDGRGSLWRSRPSPSSRRSESCCATGVGVVMFDEFEPRSPATTSSAAACMTSPPASTPSSTPSATPKNCSCCAYSSKTSAARCPARPGNERLRGSRARAHPRGCRRWRSVKDGVYWRSSSRIAARSRGL